MEVHCRVELVGTFTRGQLAIDHDDRLNQRKNARIIQSTNDELLKKVLLWGVSEDKSYLN